MGNPFPIPRQLRESEPFDGDGGAVYSGFDFKIFDIADVVVWAKAQDQTGYSKQTVTVAKLANLPFDNFSVTFPAGQPSTTSIVVRSARIAERTAGVINGTRVDNTALEKELSKQATVLEEVRRDIDRAVSVDFGAEGLTIDAEIPDGSSVKKEGNRLVAGPNIDAGNALIYAAIAAEAATRAAADAAEAAIRSAADNTEAAIRASADAAEQFARIAAIAALTSLIGQGGGPIEVPDYDSRTALSLAHDKALLMSVSTGGFHLAGDGGGARYKRVGAEPSHGGKVQSADGAWWELAENVPNEKMFGCMSDGSNDDTAAFSLLVQWAMISPTRRKIEVVGQVYCATDISNFHDVQFRGPGSIRVGSATWEYFVSPNRINRSFTTDGFNHLYVDPANGNDSASGLAPEFAFKTQARAFAVLGKKTSPLQGYWEIDLAEGVYRETNLSTYLASTLRGYPVLIKGPAVDSWTISGRPPAPTSISAITSANPPVVTSNGHGLSNGDKTFIGLATKTGGGAHAADGQIFTVGNVTANTYELTGVDGTSWAAYAGGGNSYALKGSRPKAVFYGTGNGSGWGMQLDGNCTFWLYDIMGVNYGTKAGRGDEGLLVGRTFSNVRTFNVHAYDCSKGQESRDLSVCIFDSGWMRNCFTGTKALGSSRYTFGTSNPASLLDTKIYYDNDIYGADVWDGANGHVDGNVFNDCGTEVCVRKNSHAVADHNSCTTSTRKVGMVSMDNGFLADTNNTFIGDYRPTVSRQNGGQLIVTDVTKTWISRKLIGGGTFTDNVEHTLLSVSVDKGKGIMAGDAARFKLALQGTWTTGSLTIRAKADSVALATWTLPANAAAREVVVEAELSADGFLGMLGDTMKYERQGSTQITPEMDVLLVPSFDTQAAGKTLSLSVQLSAASGDTVTTRVSEIASLGW